MRAMIIAAVALALTGCGQIQRNLAQITGQPTDVCHDGVTYVQFTSGASVKYAPDGSVVRCGK